MKVTIEKREGTASTDKHYFVDVYVNGEYEGYCIADDSCTPEECLNSVYANREIDELEAEEDRRVINSLDY